MDLNIFDRINSDKRYSFLCVAFLIIIFLCISIFSAKDKSLTYDEPQHIRYGAQMLKGDSSRFDDSKMPVSVLNTFPIATLSKMGIRPVEHVNLILRIPTMIIAAIGGIILYFWARRIYNPVSAIFTLALYVFCPNITAFSQVVTTDMAITVLFFASVYFFRMFLNRANWTILCLCALVTGIAQLTKYTAVYLFIIYFVIILFVKLGRIKTAIQSARYSNIGKWFVWFFVFIVIVIFIINAGFLFNKTFTLYKSFDFKSEMFIRLKPLLNNIPVPVPYPYLEGLDWVRHNDVSGFWRANIYLLGDISRMGWKYYYFIALLFKMPIGQIVLIFLALFLSLSKKIKINFKQDDIFIIVPVVFSLIYFNFFFYTYTGIRFILPMFPFLFLYSGRVFFYALSGRPGRLMKYSIFALFVWACISSISYFPHYLSYFNELVGDRKNSYKFLADSNLDWGQNKLYLEKYLDEHDAEQFMVNPSGPLAGKIIVSANDLVGITAPVDVYEWLNKNYEPIEHIAYSWLVFDISKEDVKKYIGESVKLFAEEVQPSNLSKGLGFSCELSNGSSRVLGKTENIHADGSAFTKIQQPIKYFWKGFLKVENTGEYVLSLISYGPSRLYLNDRLYIDNYGGSIPHHKIRKSAIFQLEQGYYPIVFEFTSQSFDAIFDVEMKSFDSMETINLQDKLFS
ncbi:conserved hypothetical protein, membrane [Candidatus Omnitrophus magneticus]|uniref:PA14 domain-containing protein n=1 Tax=Candidatus Omnitrophus magneticus TaxID=1609969 RepID=A0A0F0CKW4_9BACT|nr:conserved hypothetical protein, membrane [Candidatus Omnitrophus magneticus]